MEMRQTESATENVVDSIWADKSIGMEFHVKRLDI